MKLTKKEYKKLIELAKAARGASYSPYSEFSVGAALLLSDGEIITGANIENASFSATVCAERVALFEAVHRGKRDFSAIAVVGAHHDGREGKLTILPCAVCLQALAEFVTPDFEVVTEGEGGEAVVYRFDELLPHSFSLL